MTTPSETPLSLPQLEGVGRLVVREQAPGLPGAKYVVLAGGEVVLHAREDSGIVSRVLAGKSRAFEIGVFDTQDREVIKLRRPYTVGPDKMEVAVLGAPAAIVRKEVTFFKPVLAVHDAADRPVLRVKGPVSTSGPCEFELYSAQKQRVGTISKCWSGVSRARDSDCFALVFPADLDVRYKAALLGTCFLIDFLIYDN